jgi:hypothetical protein
MLVYRGFLVLDFFGVCINFGSEKTNHSSSPHHAAVSDSLSILSGSRRSSRTRGRGAKTLNLFAGIKEWLMTKKKLRFGTDLGLLRNLELFENSRYFLSSSIVLREKGAQTGIKQSGGGECGVKRISMSAPGIAREAELDEDAGMLRIGVAFEGEKNSLLWFCFSRDDGYYYLDYANQGRKEIICDGKEYTVSWGKSGGIGGKIKQMMMSNRMKVESYKHTEPLLLCEAGPF